MWLLITAHPDDESMFFIPTLRNLINCNSSNQKDTQSDSNTNKVQLLCLSNGDYRDVSDGPIRTKETYKACSIIGIQNDDRISAAAVTVLNDDRMKDGPNEVWSSDLIANSILEHIRKAVPSMVDIDDSITKPDKNHDYILSGPKDKKKMQQSWCYMDHKKSTSKTKSKQPNIVQTIDINLLTFDKGGVSNHPNHIDVFKGVKYLLNEKCTIETCKSSEQHIAKLRLYREKSNNNIAIELNVSVHTLRTISNPLYKYFLWMFADIIPYLFIWLFQIVVYLVYFLLGGLLWGKKGSSTQIQQFSGIRSITNGKVGHQQYRIMEPILVWRAMAAHHSQFVWYRRLSVMFSRYTYMNDLEKINPIFIQDDDEEDDGITPLPPVATIKEEESSPEFLLSPVQMNALRETVLPTGLHQRPWKRIYSLIRDGDSFVVFRKKLEDWHGSQGHQSSILVVKTTAGELIGGYASVPIVPLKSSLGSTAGSCLFRLNTKYVTENIVEVYGQSFTATKKIVFNATRCMIAFGGGDDNGIDEGFGLCLDDNFARGTTSQCSAFQNEPLVSSQDGIFDVLDVEVWGFVFGSIS